MTSRPTRVAFVLTHPVQYMSPWFAHIHAGCPSLDLTVLYATRPSARAQAEGFGGAFEWDGDLLAGYRSRLVGATDYTGGVAADHAWALDAPDVERVLGDLAPDAVVVPGWHAAVYRRAIRGCRRLGIPVIYRGDSHLASGPGGWRRPLWRLHTAARLHRYDAWLAVGQRSREYLASFRVAEPLVFDSPHAVDNERFARDADAVRQSGDARAAERRRLGLDPDRFTALYAGKLTRRKRPLDAIEMLTRLPDAQLLVVGSGDLEDECRRRAERLGVRAVFAGFQNQSAMGRLYAAADCLVLPSESETWGLVVNEALAAGLPCVVSDAVGAAPDLIAAGTTGDVVRLGDVDALAAAVAGLRRRAEGGHAFVDACRARVARHSFARATDGLAEALARLSARRAAAERQRGRAPRVVACCGAMVVRGGLERMTFEVLGELAAHGAAVHVIVNGWESSAIVDLAERIGAPWSTGRYWTTLSLRRLTPVTVARMAWDVCVTSAGLLRDARAFGATHVLVPDYVTVLRNWPALALLRARGVRIVLRVGNAPDEGRAARRLWRWGIAPVVDAYAPISQFVAAELARHGIHGAAVTVIYNTPATGRSAPPTDVPRDPGRVIYVGQVIPLKGLDVLIDAVGLLVARGLDVRLDVVGEVDGWESPSYAGYRACVRERAARLEPGRVRFLGHREDVPALLAAAAVHACPSLPDLREALGTVVLEAKAAGLPSVVIRSGGLPEMIEHGVDGWIAEPTVESLAEGLARFLEDADARAAAGRAAEASLEQFSRERFRRAWLDAFGMRGS
ncbi:MAG: glycosyltransferase [Acidobacteriota bacterium]